MARIPDVSGDITTRAHIASDMGPGKGSRIPRDMAPPGTISLAIWYRGGSTKGGGGGGGGAHIGRDGWQVCNSTNSRFTSIL